MRIYKNVKELGHVLRRQKLLITNNLVGERAGLGTDLMLSLKTWNNLENIKYQLGLGDHPRGHELIHFWKDWKVIEC